MPALTRLLPMWLLLVVGLGASWGLLSGQQQPPWKNLVPGNERDRLIGNEPDDILDPELDRTIRLVDRSFSEGDESALDDCLGPNKIFVSIRTSSGGAGYYTRSQLQFILNKIFEERQTREFVFSEEDLEMAEKNRAFLRSYWTYMVFDSDTLVTENIRFQFERKGSRWLITEIRASAR